MAAKEILLRLPFHPTPRQVFYVENGYDEEVNTFIRDNHKRLQSAFRRVGMEFCYLPYLFRGKDVEAKLRYYAPYLPPAKLCQTVRSDALARYICDAEAKATLAPSIIFGGRREASGDVTFKALRLSELIAGEGLSVGQIAGVVSSESEDGDCCAMPEVGSPRARREMSGFRKGSRPEGVLSRLRHSLGLESDAPQMCHTEAAPMPMAQGQTEEERSLIETDRVLQELRATVQRLRLEGVSLMAIHEFIDRQEPLSRMVISPDYRIFLPDYNDMEIQMGSLPKALYFLFLRYPEGIVCKCMPDYFSELLNIYRQLRPGTDEARLKLTVTKVVNPLGNALNENIARIRKAFVEKFDEHLACNYIIAGERGLRYSVTLPRELITWEE